MRVPVRLLPLTAVTAACALLTGCFSSAGSDEASAEGKRIRVAHMLPPRSGLSPLSDDAFKLSRWSTAETLVKLNAIGDAQPALATKWQQSGRTWTFEIRDGVTFRDGTKLDAEAVVRSLTRAAGASPKPRILDGVELTAKAEDADTVTVTTGTEDPLVPQRLSSPQLSILAAKAYKGKTVNPVDAGTGPFELVEVNGTASAALAVLQLRRPDAGEVLFEGRELTTLTERELRPLRPRMQPVFQDPYGSLSPRHRIRDAVAEPLKMHGRWTGADGPARVAELLDRVGLDPSYGDRLPGELSGGQCQRAGIARALASEPRLLVLDEPVSSLDPSVRAGVLNLLADLQDDLGLGYLFICHDRAVVRHFADRTIELREGRVISG